MQYPLPHFPKDHGHMSHNSDLSCRKQLLHASFSNTEGTVGAIGERGASKDHLQFKRLIDFRMHPPLL